MARNNMNFSASLKLNTKEFRKGIADVQRSLKGLQSTFLSVAGALGAGLGLSSLLSNLKETAVQLSVAKNVLENVSHTTKEWNTATEKGTITLNNYGENLEFVRKLAKDYRQDLTTLINSFAQFHAACEGTNITLEQQKKIYESLTKAAAFYHMSTERTRDMNTAIIQMASKGRITAEELRRQFITGLAA